MNSPLICREIRAAAAFVAILAAPPAFAGDAAWNPGISGPWATAGNWTPAAAPGSTATTDNPDTATFGPTLSVDRTVTVDANRNIGRITFSNTSNFKHTLTGGSLLLSNYGVIQTTGGGTHADTISTPISIQGDYSSASFTASATSTTSVMTISGAVSGAPSSVETTLFLDGANTGSNTVSGVISDGSGAGPLSISKGGDGKWQLSGANSHTGGTQIYSGTLVPTVTGALGSAPVTVDGGTAVLSLGATSVTAGQVNLINGSITSTTGVLTGTAFNLESGTISAILAGPLASVNKSNFGTVTLSGANTYGGYTYVNDGVLQVKKPGSLPGQTLAGRIRILPFATLSLNVGGTGEFAAADVGNVLTNATISSGGFLGLNTTTTPGAFTYSSNITGSTVGIAKLGTGTLTLSGTNTYGGGTKVVAGTLTTTVNDAFGSGRLTMEGGTLNLATFNDTVGAVQLINGTISSTTGTLTGTSFSVENGTISAKLAGSGGLTKDLSGTVTLSGVNSYTGTNLINNGTLSLTGAGTLGNTANALTVDGASSILSLAAVSQTAGVVRLKNGGSITSSTGILTGSSFAVESGSISAKLAGAAANLTKTTADTVILSGTNTYGGTTAVNGGILQVKTTGSLPGYATAGRVTVGASGTLIVDGSAFGEANITSLLGAATFASGSSFGIDTAGSFTYAAAIPNKPITFVKSGAGTLTLSSATNAYTGGTKVLGGTLSFGTTGKAGTGALTVDGSTSILNLSTLSQSVGAVNLLNGGSITGTTGTLTGTSFNVEQGTISAILAGGATARMVKANIGTVTLSGANTFSGGLTLTDGILELNSAGALGTTGTITFGSGTGTLKFSANNTTDYSARFTTTASQDLSFEVPANLSVTLAGALTSSGGSLTKYGDGTLVLSSTNTNTYSGGTYLYAGTLRIPKAASLPGKTTYGRIYVDNYSLSTNLSVNAGGTGEFTDGDFDSLMTNASFIFGPTLSIDTTSAGFTCSSDLTAEIKLAKLGSNTLTLSGANTYNYGTQIGLPNQPNAGTLLLSGSGKLGDQLFPGPLEIHGGTLDLNGTTQAIGTLVMGRGAAGSTASISTGAGELVLGDYVWYDAPTNPNGATISSASASSGKLSLTADTTFNVGDSTAAVNDLTISANMRDSDATARSIIKNGSGTLLLSGNNTYSGSTTVDSGTLWVTKATALPVPAGSGEILMRRLTSLNVKAGGPDEFNSAQLAAVLAKSKFTADTVLGNASFGIDTTNASGGIFTYAGNLADASTGPPNYTLDLRKLGTGTLKLTGTNNTYSGTTSIVGGTLQVDGILQNGGLVTVPTGTSLVLSSGGTIKRKVTVSGGTFDLNGTMIDATAQLTVNSGTVNLAGTIGTGASLSQTGGTVRTVGTLATISNLVLPLKATTPVFDAASGRDLIVTGKLTQPYSGGTVAITAGTPAFKVSGTNLVNNIDKLTLQGGTTRIEGLVGNFSAGLDVRGWQGASPTLQIEGARFNLTSPSPAPNHSSILPSTTLGYATASIHTEAGDWFTTTGSGVVSGSKPTGYSSGFALEYRGKLRIASAGNYTFATRSDDGSALWINPGVENPPYSSAVVQNNFSQGMMTRQSSPISLAAGDHDIIIRFNQGSGGQGLWVLWDPAGGTNFVDIPGANFFHGSQSAGASNLAGTEIAPVASPNSTLNFGSASYMSTLGNLSLSGGTLTLQNGLLASFNNITASETSIIDGTVPIALRGGNVTVNDTKTLTINPAIANDTITTPAVPATSLTKLGNGTLILNGANTHSGTTTLTAGTLTLGNANALQNSIVAFNGGVLDTGSFSTVPLGGVTAKIDKTLSAPFTTIIGYPTWSADATKTLTIGSTITRTQGAAINFGTTGTITGGPLETLLGTNTLNPWATSGLADWAVYDGSKIAAYTAYTALGGTSSAATIPNAPTANYRINNTTTGTVTLAATGTIDINSLVVNGVTARTVNVKNGFTQGTLRLGTNGGILLAGGVHTIGLSGTAGTLTAGGATLDTAGELPVMANANATINSVIADNGTGKVSLTKYGTGVLTLNGNNTYSGDTRINYGSLTLTSAGTIPNGAGKGDVWVETGATLNLSTAKTINGLNGTGTVNGTASIALTLGGNNASGSFAGVLKNSSGALGVTKTGTGTQTLTGTSTYTGATTVNGGTLALDFSVSSPAKILATTGLTLGGGTLNIKGKATGTTAQTLGTVTVNAGGGRILGNVNGGTSTTLTLGTLSSTAAGGSLLVGTAGANTTGLSITTTLNKPATAIYSGRSVFFNGTADTGYDWLTTTTSSPYVLSGLASGSYTTMLAGATSNTSNVISGSLPLSGVHTHNSLKITTGTTLAIGANTLTLTSGGLLSVGNTASTISGTAGASRLIGGNGSGANDLIVHQFNSAGLNISAVIGNNGANATALTKAGTGPLTLSGINTYTGATTVNSGMLLIDGAGSINSSSSITIRGGEFSYNSSTPLTKAVTFSDPGATLSGASSLGTAATTIQGIHAPGNPSANGGVGTQTFTAGLTYGANSRLQWQLIDNVIATRGTHFDAVNVTAGALAITPGATLDLVFGGTVNFANSFWDTDRSWTVVDVSGTATAPGTNPFTLGTITGGNYNTDEGSFSITRSAGDVILEWKATTVSAYELWASSKGLTGTNNGVSLDPDKDGVSNLAEFAFNGNPTDSSSSGQIHGLNADSSDGGTAKELILTVAVRKNAPAFTTGAPSTSSVDGITYRIEGGTNLSAWTTTVTPVAPLTSGLPAITDPANYEYRSFSLSGSDGLPGKGFLRAGVTSAIALNTYEQWASSNGLTSKNNGASEDPDNDGASNLVEFAFNGNPTSGSSSGQIHGLNADSADGGTAKELILTVAVRKNAPAFTTGAPSISSVDGITYRIEGGTNLATWATTVTPVAPLTSGLPAITDTANYEYRSFSLSGSDGLPGKGFLRARVTQP